jgi:5'-AMP-activated protein kinase regulatory gamma subunit
MTHALSRPLMECNIGTYVAAESDRPPGPVSPFWPMCTATLQTTVFDVVHMCSERGISAVPIVDENGVVVNLYETVDVIVSFPFLPLSVSSLSPLALIPF